MIRVSSLYKACGDLFATYPLAARVVDWGGTLRSMILMLRNDGDVEFFVLAYDCGEGRPFYSVSPWRAGGTIVDIEADGGDIPDGVVNAVTRGVPLPRHGSLFGWRCGDDVTALIAVYAKYSPASPYPSWAVLPLACAPKVQWPPFTNEHPFKGWSWEYYWAGSMVSLDSLIAGAPGSVFWVDTEAILGWDCCAVVRDIGSREGYTLRRGCYVYSEALQAGKQVPPLDVLLSGPGRTDLAPRFGRSGNPDS